MFQRDYLLRLIEMMGDLARRVAELMDELDRLKLMDDQTKEHCGMSVRGLETLDAQSLCQLLAPRPRLFASEMLYLRAAQFPAGCGEAEELLLKSLRLLASLYEEGPLCETRLARMREIKAATLARLGFADRMACARFFGEAESYGDMEDALFQALELARGGEREECAAEGAALLRAAAHANERALAACGMTAGELRQAARELEQCMEQRGTVE